MSPFIIKGEWAVISMLCVCAVCDFSCFFAFMILIIYSWNGDDESDEWMMVMVVVMMMTVIISIMYDNDFGDVE